MYRFFEVIIIDLFHKATRSNPDTQGIIKPVPFPSNLWADICMQAARVGTLEKAMCYTALWW